MKISLQRIDDAFNMEAVDEQGHKVLMDSSLENGGKNNGVRPMQMLLMGLGGCSAIDVAMILKKQRQELTDFKIEIDGEREKGKEPSIWENVHIIFHLSGTSLDPDKAARAVELSMTKYCSVAETLRRAGGNLTWETRVNG
ncbi:MAG: OsmC family protein [Bacteroidetes bacterium]|uniref:OsmC family protein n=1 Tax=unclassified Chitinophaga TaxID=2619133 RepID=UPI0009CBDACB|nr:MULTISPECIES: OsmC family protein [unclassified Chitinophaga]MBP1652042.1 OsmC family protein [Bacteroidota bacterium]OMP77322.1 osmotically inducible protein OsmC [[Flexibacter] sp. ATCC 35208]WPV65096.1 OsmC family protein [Chitinophaga sp. LS1]